MMMTAASGLLMFQRLLFRRRSHLRRSRRRRRRRPCSNRCGALYNVLRWARASKRGGEGEWWPAIVDQVCEDAYEVEWVEEPEVFNRLDLEDVRAARASPHFVAAPPTVPPAWTNAVAALATSSSPPSKGVRYGSRRRSQPLQRAWSRGRRHLLYKRRPRRLLFPPRRAAGRLLLLRRRRWPPRAEPAPLLPMAVAPPPSVPPIVAGRGRAASRR